MINKIKGVFGLPFILVNKDEYMPDKITKGMIFVSDEDEIECR